MLQGFSGFIGFCQETQSGLAVACIAPFLAPGYTEGKKKSSRHTMHVGANESSSSTPACRTFVVQLCTHSKLLETDMLCVCARMHREADKWGRQHAPEWEQFKGK